MVTDERRLSRENPAELAQRVHVDTRATAPHAQDHPAPEVQVDGSSAPLTAHREAQAERAGTSLPGKIEGQVLAELLGFSVDRAERLLELSPVDPMDQEVVVQPVVTRQDL